jgi:ribosomal-protein-alanine N-acetyltransferase
MLPSRFICAPRTQNRKRTKALPAPTHSGLLLTPINAGDAEHLAALHGRCFERGWSPSDFARIASIAPYAGLAAREAGILAGFVAVSVALDEAEILSLAVDPPFRRGGIAAAMLTQLAGDLRGIGVEAVFLEVSDENDAAKAAYVAAGYAEIGRRAGYYSTDAGARDALIMKRDLRR